MSTKRDENGDPVSWQFQAPWLRFLRRHIWKIGIVYGLVFVTCWTVLSPGSRPALPQKIADVPDFGLVERHDKPFTRADLQGKVWVVGFIFTRCGSVCPQISAAMSDVQQMLAASKLLSDVNLLSISVDPEYDTPQRLREYAQRFGADEAGWAFVSGPRQQIESLVVGGFKTAIGEVKETAPGAFDIAHSSKLALVDRHGAIRGYYSVAGSPEERKEELERLYNMLFTVMRAQAGEP